MKIDEKFSIEVDTYNVILIERRAGVNPKTKEHTTSEFKRYYPTVATALRGYTNEAIKHSIEVHSGIAEFLIGAEKLQQQILKKAEDVLNK